MAKLKEDRPHMRIYFPSERAKRVAKEDLKEWFGTASNGVRNLIKDERRRRLKLDKARQEIYDQKNTE